MSIEYDSIETEIIMQKLSGIVSDTPDTKLSGNGINIKMLDSLDRMNRTSVNRSYRPIASESFKEKVSCIFKRLIRRMTFWFVEPCMMQQTEYNSANNIFSAEVNSEINTMRLRMDNMESLRNAENLEKAEHLEKKECLEKKIHEMNGQIALLQNVISNINISFSQSGEDSIIKYIFSTLNKDIKNCTYLDLGANHAVHLSNTYSFYSKGARGVLLEANPELADELTEQRPEDIVINKCLAEKSGESLDFYIMNGDGLSTTDYGSAQNFIKENPSLEITKTITVDSITINEIINRYFSEKAPDIMNIDIEGMELAVLKMTDFERFRPLVIICEMIDYKNGLTVGQKNQNIIDLMHENDYEEFAFTGINSIFIDRRQEEIFK